MTLMAIVAGTLVCGVGSVWCAAALSFGPLARFTNHMLSLAAGALLATALLHLMPEVLESHIDAHTAFAVLLAGLIFFFLLDKAQLWHHGHEHDHSHNPNHNHSQSQSQVQAHDYDHDHAHGHDHHHHAPKADKPFGAWSILVGDSVHCFGDGILIAAAFMADMRLGILATLAVLTHEIPHHVGDLLVLRPGGNAATGAKGQGVTVDNAGRNAAIVKVSLAGAVTTVGGIAGYFLLESLQDSVPYFLMLASSSFVYVALADLIPQLQKQLTLKQTMAQVFWLFVGIAAVMVVSSGAHNH